MSGRTLRSLPLSSAKSQDPDIVPVESPGGASTPEYVKRTARLFESPDGTSVTGLGTKSKTSDTPSVVVVNGNSTAKTGECSLGDDNFKGKKPSYLGLACSISGYSGITTYDSKLREGFRSRDHSPGRISIIKSRDASPLRSNGEQVTPTYKSECGNFLVAPAGRDGKVGSVSPCKISVKSTDVSSEGISTNGKQLCLNHVNGGDKIIKDRSDIKVDDSGRTMEDEKFMTNMNGLGMAAADSSRRALGSSRYMESYSGTSKQEFFSSSTCNIRQSTRNFMSSMLTTDSSFSSTHYESSVSQTTKSKDVTDFSSPLKNSPLTSVPRDSFGAFSPVKCSPESPKTAARDSPGSHVTSSTRDSSRLSSPLKPSPESPKTSSKDSLTAPLVSPQKRSPGAVRVVEFTSQTKSYVRTAFVSGNSVESPFSSQGYSDIPQSKGLQTSYMQSSRSVLNDGESHTDTSYIQTNGSNAADTMWSTKSFIQQRVERLYGPGALAQGFFKRVRSKPPDELQV